MPEEIKRTPTINVVIQDLTVLERLDRVAENVREGQEYPDYRGECLCHAKTHQFIKKINEFNNGRIHSIKDATVLDMSCLPSLYEQIKQYSIDFEAFEQLFNHLFSLFDDNETDASYIWKCIYVLIDKVSYSELETFI